MNKTLSNKRKELFEIILKEKPTAGRIYRIIRQQDKEFLKEENTLLHLYFMKKITWTEFNLRRNALIEVDLIKEELKWF